jgi:hypothetical protein
VPLRPELPTAKEVEAAGTRLREVEVWPAGATPLAPGDWAAYLRIEGSPEYSTPKRILGSCSMQATECAFHALRRYCEDTGAWFDTEFVGPDGT